MPTSDWLPTVAAVGARLRARTRDNNGAEVGTFTDTTRPTGAQVEELISQAQSDVASVVGEDIPSRSWADAQNVTVLGAAMAVELSYYPEQIGTGRSPYAALKELYDERLKRLQAAVIAGEAGPTSDPGAALRPSYAFPLGDPYLIGRGTPW